MSTFARIGALVAVLSLLRAPTVTPLSAQEATSSQREYPEGLYAELHTSRGMIVLALDFQRTPLTVASFVGLAEGTIRNRAFPPGTPFFDGTVFHRVEPGHVIQAGSPASQVANTPGFTLPNEIHPELGHDRAGVLAMANGGPHTGTSQFYITLGERSYLDGDYVVFGEVFGGLGVVTNIVRGDVVDSVRVVRVGEEAEAFRPDTESFSTLRTEVAERNAAAEERLRRESWDFVERAWPEAIRVEAGWRYVVTQEGTGSLPATGGTLTVRYIGRTPPRTRHGGEVGDIRFGSAGRGGGPHFLPPGRDDGEPMPWPGTDGGQPFSFIVGETSVNPGFNEAVSQMRPGEKRIVIVPADLGYDPVGYYGGQGPSGARFVIRPFSMLIYEIEVMAG